MTKGIFLNLRHFTAFKTRDGRDYKDCPEGIEPAEQPKQKETMDSHIDIEKTQKVIAFAVEKIKTEIDPWVLEEYHSLFKKKVSLFHRSKVAAYLLMLVEQGKSPNFPGRNSKPKTTSTGRNGSARPEKTGSRRPKGGHDRYPASLANRIDNPSSDLQRYPLADKDSKWLFFSIGRSRRVSPREILSLINTKIAIPKEDIGAIRIFDNYSFVQVRDTEAEKIIEALRGYIFRGRPLSVDYARSRKDEEGGENGRTSELSSDLDAAVVAEDSQGGMYEADDSDQHEENRHQEEDI